MGNLKNIYNRNINGVIITLIFHIVVFILLSIAQINSKKKIFETELVFDFSEEIVETKIEAREENQNTDPNTMQQHNTNIASNRAILNKENPINEALQRELEQAQNLLKDVSKQLSKEIPTIDDLTMPEETSEGLDPDSIMNKLYNGDSNVEYFLENRYHTKLKIPVYLAQSGGKVSMQIIVMQSGEVSKASLLSSSTQNEQILSFAKTAALASKFNPSQSAPIKQQGTITYTFIAQ